MAGQTLQKKASGNTEAEKLSKMKHKEQQNKTTQETQGLGGRNESTLPEVAYASHDSY